MLDLDSFRLDATNNIIYAMGDIHGDIIPLIVCLRDCCQVIKKKASYDFKQNEVDMDMINELKKESNDESYVSDLNYEWCGENAYVVICGDIINNSRNGGTKPQDFPFEEAKILKFINALNKQAIPLSGKIFKLIGNLKNSSFNFKIFIFNFEKLPKSKNNNNNNINI